MSAAESGLWLLMAVPAVTGAVLSLAGRSADRVAAVLSIAGGTLVLALSVFVAGTRPEVAVPFLAGSAFGLAVDPLSAVVLPATAAVTLLVLLFATVEITSSTARFHGLMLLFASAVSVTATATTLPTLLFAWEVMGATSYALIGFWWRDESRVAAGSTAFLTTRAADLGMYAAAAAALAGGAGLALADLADSSSGWQHVIAGGLLLAALGKAAQLPFSFWLSRAMAGPSSVSALLHSAAMVAMGGYLVLRIAPLLTATGWAATAAAWAGALTALLLGAVAVAQRDLKQLLAASTSAQLGFVVLAAGVYSVAGGTAHLVAHAATKALLFLVAGVWLAALGTKALAGLRGAARQWPLVGAAATAGLLSLAGVAPFALWATKDEILSGVRADSWALYVVAQAGAVLSAAYAGKALVLIWAADRSGARKHWDEEERGARRVHVRQKIPLVVLAAGATGLAALALPPLGHRLRSFLGAEAEPTSGAVELVVSALVALAVVAVVARRRVPETSWAAGWLGLEAAVDRAIVRPTAGLASRLARFDDLVLDRAVEGIARRARDAATWIAAFDDQRLDRAVEDIARGGSAAGDAAWRADVSGVDALVEGIARFVRRVGSAARLPQTGQLHDYYAQAVAVLGVSVLILVVVR